MMAHLWKIVWNRKRWNALILLEIFLSFLVLFAISVSALSLYSHSRHPLGFDGDDVWVLDFGYPTGATKDDQRAETFAKLDQLAAYLDAQPEVVDHGLMTTPPYTGSNWSDRADVEGRRVLYFMSEVDQGLAASLDLPVTAGRWFAEQDYLERRRDRVVINRRLADALFPGIDPVGQVFKTEADPSDESQPQDAYQIIGVVEDFRKEGSLQEPRNFMFLPLIKDEETGWLPSYWLLEMAPGTTAEFEQRLVDDVKRIAPDFSLRVLPMPVMRSQYVAAQTRDLKMLAVIAFFMLGMVAMGLIGVLWQHVTRRTVELGVRRAKGATRTRIYQQVTGEFLLVATMALAIGFIVVAQVPMLGVFEDVSFSIMTAAFVLSALAIYLLTFLASLYPGWMATRITPAEALHYE